MKLTSTTPTELTDLELEFMKEINPNIKDMTSQGKYFFYLPLSSEARHLKYHECQQNVAF